MIDRDAYNEHRADFHVTPGDESDRFEPSWVTCTFCFKQSPPVNNGGGECPYCNSQTEYIETIEEYTRRKAKEFEREEL